MYLQAHTAPRAASCMSQTETSKLLGRQVGSAGCMWRYSYQRRSGACAGSEQDLGALSISILVALVRCVESGWVQACLCVSYIRILSDPYHQIDARPRLLNPNRFITPSTSKSFLPFPYTHLHLSLIHISEPTRPY